MNLLFLGSHPTEELIRDSKGRIDSLYRDDLAIIKGLRSVKGVSLDVITSPDVASYPRLPLYIKGLYDYTEKTRSLPVLNIPIIKQLWIICSLFIAAKKIIKENADTTTIIIPYIVFHHAVPAYWLKRLFQSKVRLVTIVPDIFFPKQVISRQLNKIAENCVRKSDGFVLYTADMATYLKVVDRPFEVIEGFKEIEARDLNPEIGVFKIVYAGSLNLRYGCGRLVEAMKHIHEDNIELHLYGEGSAVEMIKDCAEKDIRIHYWGRVSKEKATDAIFSANVLVNPRSSTDGEFVSYSFPSKNLDYLGTGIPSVLCKLPGMPKEYYGYFIDAGNGTSEELANAIMTVYRMSIQDRDVFGHKAKSFILARMDTHNQGTRIVEMINKII